MAYFVVKTIESETSYLKKEWPMFVFKEFMDNACDWLNDYYPPIKPEDADKRRVSSRIWITMNADSKFMHFAVRNSNINNIPTFTTLEQILNFDLWHSTKRDQHRMTAGSLGDALKRCLGMGYALWTEKDNQ